MFQCVEAQPSTASQRRAPRESPEQTGSNSAPRDQIWDRVLRAVIDVPGTDFWALAEGEIGAGWCRAPPPVSFRGRGERVAQISG
jgi:hypothetical protein